MEEIPFVTVIMPILNEAGNISATLSAVLNQDYPHNSLEIILSDGYSKDGTRAIIENMQLIDNRIRIIDNPERIVSTAINRAFREAKGDIIIRVDGHTIIHADYVSQCVKLLSETSADNVGGKMETKSVSKFGESVAIATSTPFGVGGARFHYSDQEEWVDTVYMGAWSRRVFEKIGLFDEELVRDQDDEFNYRLRENGGKILLSPKIKSEYTVRSTPKALWRQYFQYGFWKVRVLQKHPLQMCLRQFVPPLLAASLFSSIILSLFFSWGWLFLIAVTGCYIFANLSASILTEIKLKGRHLYLLPLTFAILHLSYGTGFLVGLIKFWNRWGDKKGKVPISGVPGALNRADKLEKQFKP